MLKKIHHGFTSFEDLCTNGRNDNILCGSIMFLQKLIPSTNVCPRVSEPLEVLQKIGVDYGFAFLR